MLDDGVQDVDRGQMATRLGEHFALCWRALRVWQRRETWCWSAHHHGRQGGGRSPLVEWQARAETAIPRVELHAKSVDPHSQHEIIADGEDNVEQLWERCNAVSVSQVASSINAST
jgi:hypothetical protein